MIKYDKLEYNDERHEYKVSGKRLISVTQIIKKYTEELNLVDDYSFKYNLDKDYVKELWKIKGNYGALKGTELHFYMEHLIKGNLKFYEPMTDIKGMIKYADLFFNKYIMKGEEIYSELKVYSEKLGIAGTIDLLIKINGKYYILDWKTDKKIETSNIWSKYFKKPINDIGNFSLNKYALQLTLYKKILKEKGIDVRGLSIIHFSNDGYKIYKLDPMEKEVDKILNDYKIN